MRFTVDLGSALPSGTTQITNTATIGADGANGPDLTPNNNIGGVAVPLNPTAIALASFSATTGGSTIVVRWVTTAEHNTWGFHLYRSADGARTRATRVTPELILGRGRGQGAVYAWTDSSTEAGVRYTYWLQETELDGTTNEYGPASATGAPSASGYRIYLPRVGR